MKSKDLEFYHVPLEPSKVESGMWEECDMTKILASMLYSMLEQEEGKQLGETNS